MRSLTVAVATAAAVLLPAAPAWAANGAPVAADDAVSFRNTGGIGHVVNALANDTDPDGDPLTYTAVTPAGKGRSYLQAGTLHYEPYAGNSGTDSFTYTVTDGRGNTATGTVTATLWVDPDKPTGVAISGSDFRSATVTWNPAGRAGTYRVHRNGVLVTETSGLAFTDVGLSALGSYEYHVVAVNGGGFEGPRSEPVHRRYRLQTPWAVDAGPTDDPTTVLVTWDGSGKTGPWHVYRDGTQVASVMTSQFRDTGLVTGREYGYQVQHAFPSTATDVYPASALSAAVRATPSVLTEIGLLVHWWGGDRSALGPVTVPERAVPGGRQQDHRNGVIVQRDGGRPITVMDDFATAFAADGGVQGGLGFPLQYEGVCGVLDDAGCRHQSFEGGSIWSSEYTPTSVVLQLIDAGWAAAGRGSGPLGYPFGDQMVLRGGVKQEFEGGDVYWSPSTGSHGVASPLWEPFAAAGAENGRLGYPTAGENCALRGDGCVQTFQGGLVYWSPSTGAHVVLGAIRAAYARQGWETGRLGYPTTGEMCGLRGGGCVQSFQGGLLYWSPSTGAHVVLGAIRTAYAKQGWETGRLGYPTTGEMCGLRGGGCVQQFQGGSMYWSPPSGARVVLGAIRTAYGKQGWETGGLGYPTTGESCGLRGGGCFQEFQGGAIYWSPASGAHVVSGGLRDAWARQGWERGRLGYPVSGPSLSGGAFRQTFQGGTIAIGARGTQITYR